MPPDDSTTTTTTAAEAQPTATSITPAPIMIDAPQLMSPPVAAIESDSDNEIDKVRADDGGDTDGAAELQAQIEALKSAQEESAQQLERHTTAMRETLLARLGVMEKYRSYAPPVDPFSDDGRAKLETWAKENAELLEQRPASAPSVDIEAIKKNIRSPHLVDLNSFAKSLKGV